MTTEVRSRYPRALRTASATAAAFAVNLVAVVGLLVVCGEPPYHSGVERAVCSEDGTLAVPWYLLIAVPPAAVVLSAFLARRYARPVLFETTWICLVALGFAVLIAVKLGD